MLVLVCVDVPVMTDSTRSVTHPKLMETQPTAASNNPCMAPYLCEIMYYLSNVHTNSVIENMHMIYVETVPVFALPDSSSHSARNKQTLTNTSYG